MIALANHYRSLPATSSVSFLATLATLGEQKERGREERRENSLNAETLCGKTTLPCLTNPTDSKYYSPPSSHQFYASVFQARGEVNSGKEGASKEGEAPERTSIIFPFSSFGSATTRIVRGSSRKQWCTSEGSQTATRCGPRWAFDPTSTCSPRLRCSG